MNEKTPNERLEMTDEQLKEAAYQLCRERGLDPDEKVQYSHPKGYAVACYTARWALARDEIQDLQNKINALQSVVGWI